MTDLTNVFDHLNNCANKIAHSNSHCELTHCAFWMGQKEETNLPSEHIHRTNASTKCVYNNKHIKLGNY